MKARLLCIALLACALAAILSPAAGAARDPALPDTLTSAHFQVHFNGDAGFDYRINVMQANDLAAWAERAYATYVSWGYTPPLDDGDGRTDFYVTMMGDDIWGSAESDSPLALTSPAYATVNAKMGLDERKIAHLVFHVFQAAGWNPLDVWLREAGAEWAAFRLLGFPMTVYSDESNETVPITASFSRTAIPLDCVGDQCGDTIYEQGNYQAWPFFAYLGERFGTQIVKEIHDRGPALGDPNALGLDFVDHVLAAKGAHLADVFTDWTNAAMSGSYVAPGLKGTTPQTWTTLATGISGGQLAATMVSVNHLSVRYVGLQRGSAGSSGPCHPATLTLNVALPAGVHSRPHFYWPAAGSVPIPLAITGSTATLNIPWDTCTWSAQGLLSLPNASRGTDGVDFTVSGTLTVDKTRLATSTPPPAGSYTGPVVSSPVGDEPPSIALYGPETLRVSKKKRVVRVVVFSSGDGRLNANLGALSLGTRSLRTGNNDLRFTLPRNVTRTLAAVSRLTLTSVSPAGTRGATVTRRLVLTK